MDCDAGLHDWWKTHQQEIRTAGVCGDWVKLDEDWIGYL